MGGAVDLERLDQAVGDRLERVVVSRHRRRLRRAGQLTALDAPAGGWAAEPPPRPGNRIELHVDGASAFPRLVEAIRGARSHVHLAGWHFTPELELEGTTLRELLAEAARRVDVRVLQWAGAPLPLFHPDRREVRAGRERLSKGTRIRHELDAKERPMHCHHEKLAIVDGEVAFVGGIDLSLLGGDRRDESAHPPRGDLGWHDAASRLEGPAVADVASHFAMRWAEVTGEELAPTEPAERGEVELQVVRTVPNNVYDRLPRGDFTILESYLRALRSAEQLIYLESQFLWSPELVGVLADKLSHPPSDDFRLVVLLPAQAKNGQEDTRGQLGVLIDADDGAGRFLACTLWQPGPGGKPVYVHAKIGIVDDRWLTIGSANLNEHSLFNDSEMNVVTHDPGLARQTRLQLWAEHLECHPAELEGEPARIVDERWRPLAEEQLERAKRDGHGTQKLRLLPRISRRTKGMLGPLNGLLVDG
jgi:phosphatidylserine/phosphatidylglycerophosphate/cardiolipin synthase-like enzyme